MLAEELEPMLTPRRREYLTIRLAPLSQKQRKALSAEVRRCSDYRVRRSLDDSALVLAVLGCLTGVRQVAGALRWLRLDRDAEPLAAQVLRDRSPHWLPGLPAALLAGNGTRLSCWRLIRALVREGLVPMPDDPAYVTAMPNSLVPFPLRFSTGRQLPSVREMLLADPGLLEGELWRCLATEGTGKAMRWADGWLEGQKNIPGAAAPERTWRHALVRLSTDGVIDRGRLLDTVLTAFLRDWPASDLAWFASFHLALAPTPTETSARQATYSRLLCVQPGPPVMLAQRQLATALKAGTLDPDVLLAASPQVLSRADKGPVRAQLQLLGNVAGRYQAHAGQVAQLAAIALDHPGIDVQDRARSLIDRLPAAPEARVPAVQRPGPGLDQPTPTRVPAAPAPPAGDRSAAAVAPVSSPEELGDLLARLVEEADDPVQVERALDGLARFARRKPAGGADVLIRRAAELVKSYFPRPFSGQETRADLAALTLVWLAHAQPGPGYQGRTIAYDTTAHDRGATLRPRVIEDWSLTGLVALRTHEVARCVAAGGGQLLALPDRASGALDAGTLSARLRQIARTAKPWQLDAGITALRLAPGSADHVEWPTAHRTARLVQQQLQALRAYNPAWERLTGPSPGLWTRHVYDNSITWRDKNARKGGSGDAVAAVLDRSDPLKQLGHEAQDGEYAARFEQVTAMWPLMIPHHPELLAAHSLPRLNRSLHKNRAGAEPLLNALARSTTPTGPVTCTALALGLAAKNAPERTHAIDALADLAASGALDGTELGHQIAALLSDGIVIGERVARSLAEAARTGDPAQSAVLDALGAVLGVLPGRRDAHHFMALAASLATRQQRKLVLPAEFTKLANGDSRSQLAIACRRIPRITPAHRHTA